PQIDCLIVLLYYKDKDVISMHMEFLYFPEDKSEYIPSLLMLSIFVIGAIVAVYLFYKKSKKEDAKPHKEYQKHIQSKQEETNSESDNKKSKKENANYNKAYTKHITSNQ